MKLVRKLEKGRWLSNEILGGHLQADAFKNFKTSNNKLSVFCFNERDQLPIIITAIVCGCNKIERAEYAVFEKSILDEIGIQIEDEIGDTADKEVNEYHKNLINLTACQVLTLAKLIMEKGEYNEHVPKTVLEDTLRCRANSGHIECNKVNSKLREKYGFCK